MSHADMMVATKALEDALKDQEKKRLVWKLACVGRDFLAMDESVWKYAEACDLVAIAQRAHDDAVSQAQAEYFRGAGEMGAAS
jgi:hypothetical protein